MKHYRISKGYWALIMLYSLLWIVVLPLLLIIKRHTPSDSGRLGLGMPKGPFKVWIQAASIGESRLAVNLIRELTRQGVARILVTTSTRQGMEVLEKELGPEIQKAYFPFDMRCIMRLALRRIRPGCLLLLETEIWPGLLYSCRRRNIPVILGNGRMSIKSFCRYYPLRKLLAAIGPNQVAAVSERDRDRFASLFPGAGTMTMSNIKFDLLLDKEPIAYVQNPLSSYFKPKQPLIVMGSVRQEEEPLVARVIEKIHEQRPKTTIALFPRHLTRVQAWQNLLEKKNIPCTLRSRLETDQAMPGVVIWDRFGELEPAYALARSVFVGGSLMPCGGQNFLESLAQGIVPCVGPFLDNFNWVGEEIIDLGLVIQVQDEEELFYRLTEPQTQSRDQVVKKFREYLQERRGGIDFLTGLVIRNMG